MKHCSLLLLPIAHATKLHCATHLHVPVSPGPRQYTDHLPGASNVHHGLAGGEFQHAHAGRVEQNIP